MVPWSRFQRVVETSTHSSSAGPFSGGARSKRFPRQYTNVCVCCSVALTITEAHCYGAFAWHSRYVLSWRLSNTLEADSCVDALEEALSRDLPGVFNTDQGSQFTSEAFTSVLVAHGVRISMDSVGSYMDNVFVERLWRSVKYEEVYLKAYESVAEARAGIGAYLRFYNSERPHQTLDYRTPAQVFEEGRNQVHQSEVSLTPELVPA